MLCSCFCVTSGQTTRLINTTQTNNSVVTVCIMTFDRILHLCFMMSLFQEVGVIILLH